MHARIRIMKGWKKGISNRITIIKISRISIVNLGCVLGLTTTESRQVSNYLEASVSFLRSIKLQRITKTEYKKDLPAAENPIALYSYLRTRITCIGVGKRKALYLQLLPFLYMLFFKGYSIYRRSLNLYKTVRK